MKEGKADNWVNILSMFQILDSGIEYTYVRLKNGKNKKSGKNSSRKGKEMLEKIKSQ